MCVKGGLFWYCKECTSNVVPLCKGGGHEKYNVVPCDGPVNMWKRGYDMEWYRKEIFFDEDRLAKIKEWISKGSGSCD